MRNRFRTAVALAALGLGLVACGDDSGAPSITGTKAPTTTTSAAPASGGTGTPVSASRADAIQVGINDPKDPTIAVLQFMPATVTVKKGATVTWDWTGTTEPHSVTFPAPGQQLPAPGSDTSLYAPTPPTGPYDGTTFVNSGLQPLGATAQPFSLTFDATGSFTYYCVIHPQMVGTIKVVDGAGDTAEQISAAKADEQTKWLDEGRAAKKAFEASTVPVTTNADKSKTYTIEMGTSTAHTDILAFHPTPANIKAGDKVTFVNDSGAPHTASFFGTGAEAIQNPLDPRVDAPAPGPSPQTLGARGFFNTGLLPPNAPPGAGPPVAVRSFTFTVPSAGSYSYVCILHAPSSMVGSITAT
jgi:plastocyanin